MSERGVRALALIVCVAACDAGAKPEVAPAPAAKPTAKQPVVTTRGIDLAFLPADADVVIHVDVARLRKSKLWPSYSEAMGFVVAPFGSCGEKTLANVTSIDIAIPVESRLDVMVFHGVDRDLALKCFGTLTDSQGTTAVVENGFVTLTSAQGAKYVGTFLEDHRFILQGSAKAKPTSETLVQVLHAGSPLAQNQAMAAPLQRVQARAAVLVVSRPGSDAIAREMQRSGLRIAYLYGSLDLTDRLVAQYAMEMNSTDEAAQVTSMMKGQLEAQSVKALFDQIGVQTQGKTVTLDLALGETKLAQLWSMMRGIFPVTH